MKVVNASTFIWVCSLMTALLNPGGINFYENMGVYFIFEVAFI